MNTRLKAMKNSRQISWLEFLKRFCLIGLMLCGGAIVLIAVPFLALAALPLFILKSFHHTVQLYTCRWYSRNEQGIPLCQEKDPVTGKPIYMLNGIRFSEEDFFRLYQENGRIHEKEKLQSSLKLIRVAVKCLIPVVGLVWTIATDLNNQTAPFDSEEGWKTHSFWSDKEAVRWHLHLLATRLGRCDSQQDVA